MNPIEGMVTTDFAEPRPLSKPMEERDHCHCAIDIAGNIGDPIHMPELGTVWAWIAFRPEAGLYWPKMPVLEGKPHPWCNYFYDTFGGCLIALSADGKRTHVITHCYKNQIMNRRVLGDICSYEEKQDSRFPLHALYTKQKTAYEGAVIGYVGNAGYSTGAHVHWEIHHGHLWNRWENRINPEHWGQ